MSDLQRKPILQSGFISLTEKGLVRLKTTDPTIREAILMNTYRRDVNKYFYSELITGLFNRWASNPALIKDFDFRERVIAAAFGAFATPYVKTWLEAQVSASAVTKLHRAYLIELLDYLCTGAARTIDPVQWIRLLEASEKAEAVVVDLSKYYAPNGNTPIPGLFSDLILKWTSLPNGFADLLVNIYAIFGDREQPNDVADLDSD